ncbi:MAG TPA: DEAD/DEAH box helicase [Planctomycetota bacterium]|jgi:superfamily II DNA/RNA helicase|nr:DEAD/DEAH box helicase [Planctomycetota bacterium]
MSAFTDYPLLPTLQATLAEKGLVTPTEIQVRSIPLLLSGRSLIGLSPTGSGKTLAFVLPMLHQLKVLETEGHPVTEESRPRGVVIVPARELGEQVTRVFKPFTHTTRLRVRSVLGGTKFEVAKRNVGGCFEILVATPGRLLQLMDRELVGLGDVRTLVFDEADRMLDQGFLPDAGRIAEACPPGRQMAMFSATVSPAVQTLINKLFAGAELIRSEGSHQVVPTLTTINLNVPDGKRFPFLEDLLAKKVGGGTLIFTNTREQCDDLAQRIEGTGRRCLVYRGEMDKVERRANLKAFRDGEIDLLISTDLASRGLDVDLVVRVINYHLPTDLENYLHRVGRTARAGRKGLVINLVTERDAPLMSKVAGLNARTPS